MIVQFFMFTRRYLTNGIIYAVDKQIANALRRGRIGKVSSIF